MPRKSILITFGVLILVVSGLFLLVGAVFCSATLHVPKKLGNPPAGAKTVSISASDGTVLTAWWREPPHATGRCVAVLHGIADSRVGSNGFAPMFLSKGYAVLLPDSRGHGASGGAFVTYGLLEQYDVIAWSDWLKRSGCQKFYALGESLGAAILIQSAAVRPVFAAIVAECSFADLRDAAAYRLRNLQRVPGFMASVVVDSATLYARSVDGFDLRQVSPVSAIRNASTPILLIHGLADSRTPASDSVRLSEANPNDPLWLVPNAVHTGAAAAAPEEFWRRVLAWFAEH